MSADARSIWRDWSHNATLIVTLVSEAQHEFVTSWVKNCHASGLRQLAVGWMDAQDASVVRDTELLGVGAFRTRVRVHPRIQSERWYHVRPFLQEMPAEGVLLVSDVDVVWLRDPFLYFRAMKRQHPTVDVLATTDSHRATHEFALDQIESEAVDASSYGHLVNRHDRYYIMRDEGLELSRRCSDSINVGVMAFFRGGGGVELLEAATARLMNDTQSVDQGVMNAAWNEGKESRRTKDGAEASLCAYFEGRSRLGILPLRQFPNALSYGVTQLWKSDSGDGAMHILRPFCVHMTWLYRQTPERKRRRMDEYGFWHFPPSVTNVTLKTVTYSPVPLPNTNVTHALRMWEHLPLLHIDFAKRQLDRFARALTIASAMGRRLIVPAFMCLCDVGLWPGHIDETTCVANDRHMSLPYRCPMEYMLRHVDAMPIELVGHSLMTDAHRRSYRSFNSPADASAVMDRSFAPPRPGANEDTTHSVRPLMKKLSGRRSRQILSLLTYDHEKHHIHLGSEDIDGVRPSSHANVMSKGWWCCTTSHAYRGTRGVVRF